MLAPSRSTHREGFAHEHDHHEGRHIESGTETNRQGIEQETA
jgi:hypothetical protein